MSNKKQNPLAYILTSLLVAYALIADWVSKNPIIGWTVIALIALLAIFLIIRFTPVRNYLFKTAKTIVVEPTNNTDKELPIRKRLPTGIKQQIFDRAKFKCENPYCDETEGLDFHHIDGNRANDNIKNLALLCKRCHNKADNQLHSRDIVSAWIRNKYNPYTWCKLRG